jgi:hypothetical protein
LSLRFWELLIFRTDDTCVQLGYWTAIANFIARLSPSPMNDWETLPQTFIPFCL